MKTKTQKTVSNPCNFSITVPQEQVTAVFRAKVKAKDEEANANLEAFVAVADTMLKAVRSFSFSEFYAQYKRMTGREDAMAVKKLFDTYVATMHDWKKLEAVDGCYNETVFVVI